MYVYIYIYMYIYIYIYYTLYNAPPRGVYNMINNTRPESAPSDVVKHK